MMGLKGQETVRAAGEETLQVHASRWSQSLALHSAHSHPHVTDDVLSDGRLQKVPEDLEAVQQRVRLIEVVCAAVAAETKQRRRVGATDDS